MPVIRKSFNSISKENKNPSLVQGMPFTEEKYQKSNLPKITNLSKINPNPIERKKITKKSFTSNNVDIPLEKLLKP